MIIICGEPNKGIHKFRFAGFAVVDVILTVALAAILNALFFKRKFLVTLAALTIMGMISHAALGIDTALNKKLRNLLC